MSNADTDPYEVAKELRASFSRSFATQRELLRPATEDLLLVRVCDRQYAMRIPELRGLHPIGKVTPLHSPNPALLGIVGIRGQLVPTYSLAAHLDGASGHSVPRWLAICERGNVRVALAFDDFAGSVRVPASDLHMPSRQEQLPVHIAQVARIRQETCYLISTESILETITGTAGTSSDRAEAVTATRR